MYILCVLTWSLLGFKKSLGHAQIGLLYFKISDEHPHPFYMRSPPPRDEYAVRICYFLLKMVP